MPRIRQIAADVTSGALDLEVEYRDVDSGYLSKNQPFSWALTHRFGAFPAVMDRHVVEFFPALFPNGRYYGKTLGVDAIHFEPVIAFGDQEYEQMRRDALSDMALPDDYLKRGVGEHEQALAIIDSIRRDDGAVYSANLPNLGQVANLPRDAIIEAPARASRAGLQPIMQKPLPTGIAGTLASRMAWVETVVEAALEGSREKFIQALILDGSVGSIEIAACLADDLLAAHAEYLPQFTKHRADREERAIA
jgi:alpha-galactosidase